MELKKNISFSGVFSISAGAMISSGIFILPGMAFAKAGPAVFISYALAGLLGLLGILSVVELATAMPRAGGDYFFINRSLGPLLGTMSGFLGWFSLSLKSAFAVFGIAEILLLYTGINPLLSGLVLTVFFVILNLVGVKEAVTFQIGMVAGLLLLMLTFAGSGLGGMHWSRLTPLFAAGPNAILITAGFVFISFGGLLNVANIAEEVRDPKRNLPRGIISSVAVVTLLYTAVTLVVTGTLAPEAFRRSLTPVADAARTVMGTPGYLLVLTASILAFFTTANAGIMSASRYPMALSRDHLLPARIAVVNRRSGSPVMAVLLTGGLIYLSLLLPLETLVKAGSTVILTSYLLTNLSVIILRESRVPAYRPSFRVPLYPWVQIICIGLFLFFIVDLGAQAVEISLGLVVVSAGIYFFYGRRVARGEYALLHLLKRIVDARLGTGSLEEELRDILVSREGITQDHLDRLVEDAQIIDQDQASGFGELITAVTEGLASRTGVPAEELEQRFHERQSESNTAISRFMAVPHIIIDGTDAMHLTIVRNRQGISFTESETAVKAVFVLAGTADRRTEHLKILAGIAALARQDDFAEAWQEAPDAAHLKNLLLLRQRRRYH